MPVRLTQTKHFRITQDLRRHIKNYSSGTEVPTVDELALKYSVSRGTIVQVLDRLRKDNLIFRPAGKKRYIVANLHDKSLYKIALIRPDYPSPNYDEICRMVVEAGKENDWSFDLISYNKLKNLDLQLTIGDNDGAILLPTTEQIPSHLISVLKRPSKPLVLLQSHETRHVATVVFNDKLAGEISTKYLIKLGHRKILFLISEPDESTIRERFEGYKKVIDKENISESSNLLLNTNTKTGENAAMKSYEYLKNVLSKDNLEFTAIICASISGATGALKALHEANIQIPCQVSIIGLGDESYASEFLYPPLTSTEADMKVYGKSAVELLEEALMDPNSTPREIVINPILKVRKSTRQV